MQWNNFDGLDLVPSGSTKEQKENKFIDHSQHKKQHYYLPARDTLAQALAKKNNDSNNMTKA